MKRSLIERLRGFEYLSLEHICCEAADRIEQLQKQVDKLERLCKTEFEELSDDDYSEWENIAGQAKIAELQAQVNRVKKLTPLNPYGDDSSLHVHEQFVYWDDLQAAIRGEK